MLLRFDPITEFLWDTFIDPIGREEITPMVRVLKETDKVKLCEAADSQP